MYCKNLNSTNIFTWKSIIIFYFCRFNLILNTMRENKVLIEFYQFDL